LSRKKSPRVASIPSSTYRLQLNKDFPIKKARRLIPYLKKLGISHIYCSPLLEARPGSLHCYDTINHDLLDPEICSYEEFARFSRELRRNGLAILLDIVPNHMAADVRNRMWNDVLKNGKNSKYAKYFDIFWSNDKNLKIVLPVLEQDLGSMLEKGKIKLSFEKKAKKFYLNVDGVNYPLSGETERSLRSRARTVSKQVRARPVRTVTKSKVKRVSQLSRISGLVESINQDPMALMELANRQNYRLEYWATGLADLNYRRFFNVTDLVAIREECAPAFREAHALVVNLYHKKLIQALRIDHPDGLWEPEKYLSKLSSSLRNSRSRESPYVIVEKIVTQSLETLPSTWVTSGTTGYDFLNDSNTLFVDAENVVAILEIYKQFTGDYGNFEKIAFDSKLLITKRFMQPDVRRLVDLCSEGWSVDLWQAIELLVASFPVYRTYIQEKVRIREGDLRVLKFAFDLAENTTSVYGGRNGIEFLRKLLDQVVEGSIESGRGRRFFMALQQLTCAAVAKGIEDTAFYRYFPLSSMNEVGGSPDRFDSSVGNFHERNLRRLSQWPHSMLSTSTHDTKRSEDVRARINMLSEIPEEWTSHLEKWRFLNERLRSHKNPPSRSEEYLLYQTMVGCLDAADFRTVENHARIVDDFVERIVNYARKSSKEAKLETSWIVPNEEYDRSLEQFVRDILSDGNSEFLDDLTEFSEKIRKLGIYSSISQLVLKTTCPGVPDFYQGCELLDFSLVDPDNRRPVDFGKRSRMLEELDNRVEKESLEALTKSLVKTSSGDQMKLLATNLILRFRRGTPELFTSGNYIPLEVTGERKRNVIAFLRSTNERVLIVLTPRFFCEITGQGRCVPVGEEIWADTAVELDSSTRFEKRLTNILTGEILSAQRYEGSCRINVADAFSSLPYAILIYP
jgi:(1->4)-alpha-D-glucan 1-alpha-D-glucosylmutase